MTALQDTLLPVFFTALTILFVYIAQDFGKSTAAFEKEKISEFRVIRAKMRAQKFSPALAVVIKLVYETLTVENPEQGHPIKNKDLDSDITRILYQAGPWTKAEEAAKTMEDSAREVNRLDDVWYGNISAGSRLRNALYLASILPIAFIPVFYLNVVYLWEGWIASFGILLITASWSFLHFRALRSSFQSFERDYFIR